MKAVDEKPSPPQEIEVPVYVSVPPEGGYQIEKGIYIGGFEVRIWEELGRKSGHAWQMEMSNFDHPYYTYQHAETPIADSINRMAESIKAKEWSNSLDQRNQLLIYLKEQIEYEETVNLPFFQQKREKWGDGVTDKPASKSFLWGEIDAMRKTVDYKSLYNQILFETAKS